MAAVMRSIRWQAAALVVAMATLLAGALLLEGRLDRSVAALIRGTALARMQAAAAGQVLSAMQDAETGQRGYLLTMRDYYLEPYQQAEAQVGALLDRLDGLARGTPWLQDEAAQLRALVETKKAELDRTVALAREGGREAAMPTVLTDAGKTAMDGIRRSVDRISLRAEAERAQQAGLLQTRQRASTDAVQAAILAGMLLLGLAALALLWNRARLLDTQRRERLAAARLQAAIEQMRDGIVVYDRHDRLILGNSRFAPLLDLDPAIVQPGMHLQALADAHRFDPRLLDHPRPGDTPVVGEAVQDGRTLEVWRSVMPDGGQMVAVTDITRRVQAEAMARQAQKMEVLGQMTGGVAHDFNNLLQVVSANLELATSRITKAGGEPGVLARLSAARDGVARGARLTRHLLAFARRQPLAPEPLEPARVLMGMEDMLRRTLGEAVALELVIGGGLWLVRADPDGLENALLNLAVNARDAMIRGGIPSGRLTIEAANAALDDDYAARAQEVLPGQYVMFAVTDTGAGMTPDQLTRATEPFFTTKPDGQGTGLGLSMVFGFAKQSGGHFQLYSELGRGTTARLYIPRTMAAARVGQAPLSAALPARGELVLLVEDDPAVRAAAAAAVAGLGYQVVEAVDATAGLALLQGGLRPAVLFTDVVMPGPLTSRAMAEQARRMVPGLAVLFTSGYTQNSIVHNGELDPGIDLISKPWRTEDLARRLRAVLAAARATPAAPMSAPRRVLLVEDEAPVRLAAAEMLGDMGWDVVLAATAADALQRLQAGPPVDAVITDLGLPDMGGLALVAALRDRRPGLPIVVASGSEAPPADLSGPALAWLPKPYDRQALHAALECALKGQTGV